MHVRWSEKRKPKGKKDQKIINDILLILLWFIIYIIV